VAITSAGRVQGGSAGPGCGRHVMPVIAVGGRTCTTISTR
jgi:hypothetical protein